MALYIPHSIFHLVRLLYVRPGTFGPLLRTMLNWLILRFVLPVIQEKMPHRKFHRTINGHDVESHFAFSCIQLFQHLCYTQSRRKLTLYAICTSTCRTLWSATNVVIVLRRFDIHTHTQGVLISLLARPGRKQATASKLGIYSTFSPTKLNTLLSPLL